MTHAVRLISASVITAALVAGAVQQQRTASAPTEPDSVLMIFTGPGPHGAPCPPCERFRADYAGREPRLAPSLRKDFGLERWYRWPDDRAQFDRYAVDQWPTFLVVGLDGTVESRAVGYKGGEQLWRDLRETRQRPSPQVPSTSRSPDPADCPDGVCPVDAPRPQPDPAAELRTELQTARDHLASLRTELEQQQASSGDQLEQLRQQLQERERAAAGEVDRLRDELKQQAAAAAEQLQEQLRTLQQERPPAPVPDPMFSPDISTEIQPSTFSRILRGLIRIGLDVGLTQAQSEVLVPIAATGGPAGMAIAAGLWLARRYLRKRLSQKEPALPDMFRSDNAGDLQRDNSEIEQIISLRQQESRDPLRDSFFGIIFEDEHRTNPDQSLREAWTNALRRFNDVAPLSTTQTTATTQVKG